jgi:hypothetical protein
MGRTWMEDICEKGAGEYYNVWGESYRMKNVAIKYYYGDQTKDDGPSSTCSMQGGDAIWQIILVGAPEEKICEVWTRFK